MSDKREEFFDKREIEKAYDFIAEYETIQKKIEEFKKDLKGYTTDKSMEETIDTIGETIEDNEGYRYRDYKEQIELYENFDINDYNTNEGLDQEYIHGKIGGLK